MMTSILAVVVKELRDHFRDRRSLMTAAVLSMIGPLIMLAMFGQIGKSADPDAPLPVAVAHGERAPGLVRFLESHGATISVAPADYEDRVRSGALEFALVVGEEYAARFQANEPATVQIVRDTSRQRMGTALGRTEDLVRQFGAQTQGMRLVARGVSPLLMQPVALEPIDLATAASRAARIMSTMAMFLLVAAFMGGLNAALDTTAGERERGSLEPLLLNPVSPWGLVVGKWIGALGANLFVLGATAAGTAWALAHLPLEMGLRVHLLASQWLLLAAVLLPFAAFAVALQMLVGTFSRTFREAQTYVSMFGFLPVAPGLYQMFNPGELGLWARAVPFLAQSVLINDVLRGGAMSVLPFAMAGLGTLALASACLAGVVSLLKNERVIFGR
jgi:sodium transport system permease protein